MAAKTPTTKKKQRTLLFIWRFGAKKGEVPERPASEEPTRNQHPSNTWLVGASRGRIKEGGYSCFNVIYTPLSAKTPKDVGG